MIEKLEKGCFFLFLFFLPFNVKKFFLSFGEISPLTEFNSGFLYLSDLLILGFLGCWLIRALKEKIVFKKPPRALEGAFLGIVFLGLLSLFGAKNPLLGLYSLARLTEGFLVFFYLRANFKRYSLSRVFNIFLGGGVLQGLISLGQHLKQTSLGLRYLGESFLGKEVPGVAKILGDGKKIIRSYGTFPHPNLLATFLLIALIAVLLVAIRKKQTSRFVLTFVYGSLGLILLGLVLSFSRTLLFFGFLTLVIFFARLYFRPLSQHLSRLCLNRLVLLLAFYCLTLTIIFRPYLFARFSLEPQEQAISLRNFYNQQAITLIKKSPFRGRGPGNFILNIEKPSYWQNWMAQPVHNIYLLMTVELGIFGLIAFLLFLFLVLKNSLEALVFKLEYFSLFVLIFSFLAVGLFDHFFLTIQQGRLMFFLLLGILAGKELR